MRKLASIIAFPLFALASTANAQELDVVSQRLELIGDAPIGCVLGQPNATNAVNATFGLDSLASGMINISQFVNQQTGETLDSSIELMFPVTCNASHRVALRSDNGGMLRIGAVAGATRSATGFQEFVPYNLQLGWSGQVIDIPSDLGGGSISAAQPSRGDISLHLATPAGNGPLVAGQYNDIVIIEIHASI